MCDEVDNSSPMRRSPDGLPPEALGQLLDRHGAALELFARQWCRAADDVVQQAFVQLARQRPPPEQLVTWLYRVVRNGAISAARSERRRQRHEASAAELAPRWFASADGSAKSGFDRGDAAAALVSLPQEEREIIVAHLWGGLTFQEIGSIAGLSASTAHRRYVAGLQALRLKLQASDSTKSSRRENRQHSAF